MIGLYCPNLPVLHYPPRPSLFSHPFITHSAVYYSPSPPYFTQPFIIHQGLHCFSSLSLFSSPSLPSQAFIIFLALYYSPRPSLFTQYFIILPGFHYPTTEHFIPRQPFITLPPFPPPTPPPLDYPPSPCRERLSIPLGTTIGQ